MTQEQFVPDIEQVKKVSLQFQEVFRVCRIKAEPLSDKLFSHFEHD
jgi:hypothetical protein